MAFVTDIGTGTTLALGTSTYDTAGGVELLSVNWSGVSCEAIETSHMGTTGGRTYVPGDLYDPGTIELEWSFEGNATPPVAAAHIVDTITIANADEVWSWAASGFMTDFSFSAPLEDRMTATATFKVTGDIVIT